MAYMLTNDAWPAAGFLRRPYAEGDPLDAIRGIIMGSLLSLIMFWMPIGIVLVR